MAIRGSVSQIVANTRPPAGVPIGHLEEVKIIWTLSRLAGRSLEFVKKPTLIDMQASAKTEMLPFPFNDSHNCSIQSLSNPPPPPVGKDLMAEHTWSSSQPLSTINFDEMLDDGCSESDTMMPYTSSQSVLNLPITYDIPSLPISRKNPPAVVAPHTFNPLASFSFIDTAFRQILCEKPVRYVPGIKLKSMSPGPKLAEICPALFSPGYLRAMSHRSRFLSTIAQSMSSTSRRAKSDTLKSTFAHLLQSTSSGLPTNIASSSAARQAASQAPISKLEARLWLLTQKKVFDPVAAWRLKPIIWNDQSLPPDAQEMLDDGSSLTSPSKASHSDPWPHIVPSHTLSLHAKRFHDAVDGCRNSLLLDHYRDEQQLDTNPEDDPLLDDFYNVPGGNSSGNNAPRVGTESEHEYRSCRSLWPAQAGPNVNGMASQLGLVAGAESSDEMLLDDGTCSETASLLSI
ncbi:hypothetical protein MMC13_003883 [Lambiella insularis]|nr:hypothetical protein [Lambiella insularis]